MSARARVVSIAEYERAAAHEVDLAALGYDGVTAKYLRQLQRLAGDKTPAKFARRQAHVLREAYVERAALDGRKVCCPWSTRAIELALLARMEVGMEEKVVEDVAAALLNARGGRKGAPPIVNVLDIVPREYREAAMDDARAAIAAYEAAVREDRTRPHRLDVKELGGEG